MSAGKLIGGLAFAVLSMLIIPNAKAENIIKDPHDGIVIPLHDFSQIPYSIGFRTDKEGDSAVIYDFKNDSVKYASIRLGPHSKFSFDTVVYFGGSFWPVSSSRADILRSVQPDGTIYYAEDIGIDLPGVGPEPDKIIDKVVALYPNGKEKIWDPSVLALDPKIDGNLKKIEGTVAIFELFQQLYTDYRNRIKELNPVFP